MTDPQRFRILIVDDSRLVQAEYARLCERIEGVEVVGRAANGAEAIREVKLRQPDLVLMDLVMPDIDGMTALRMLCRGMPGVRVAVLSSLGGATRIAEEAFRHGAVQVLSKPIDAEQLAALVAAERARKAVAPEGAR